MNMEITTSEKTRFFIACFVSEACFVFEALFHNFHKCKAFVEFIFTQWWVVLTGNNVKYEINRDSKINLHLGAQKKGDVGKLCTTENAPWETTILSTSILRGKRGRQYYNTSTHTSRPHHQTIPKPSNSLSELSDKVK